MLDPNNLSLLKVTELKAELKKRSLPVGGLKQALVERLAEQIIRERAAAEAEATAQAEEVEEEEAVVEAGQGEEVVGGDEGVAPEPQPEPQLEPIPEVVEKREEEAVPVPQAAPEAAPVETTQTEVVVEEKVVEPEVLQEEPPKPETPIPAEVEPAVIETAPEPTPAPVPEPETEAVIATEVVEEVVVQEKVVEPEVIERASDPEAKLEPEVVETEITEQVTKEETSEPAPEQKAKFEDEVVEKPALEEVATKTEIASEEAPKSEPVVEKKGETPVVAESIPEFKKEAEAEQVKPEEPVVAAAEEPVCEIAKDEDSNMVDVPPPSLPVEETIVPGPTPVQDDTAAESASKPKAETDLQPAPTDPMDTSEEQTDVRKRKRRSITPAPSSTCVGKPENQPSNEGTISKKPRRDSTENQPQRTRPKDARFKGLFNDSSTTVKTNIPPTTSHQATDQAMNQSASQVEDEDDTPIPPSIHPATRALYIRGFARPLSEPGLKAHLTALASTPSSTSTAATSQPSDSPIEYLYLDTVRTHALIIFTNLTAATRVRVGIHTKVWPNERSRKPLWADFVPEEAVAEWVEREKQRGPRARWEVVYEHESSGDGGVRAELEEVSVGGGGGGRRRPVPGGNAGVEVLGAPTGPRGERRSIQIAEREFGARSSTFATTTEPPTSSINNSAQRTTTSTAAGSGGGGGRVVVKDLDLLFRSTTTKPKLYWMPVEQDISRERLAEHERNRRPSAPNHASGGDVGARRRR
ncbi:hypothetical protein L873DRAFT_1832812 [Choiromyces venosus 120613-1]|uniref:SAP domain-containing protein n=1 Tax=Choiromyces venosus 120613-1 TaxID=1336337 RepID=A0A3N4K7D8_9PEZI|nr:hypothetical protein L873DRAFT_1832812 [Choiromyces venosus 120613-1]